MPSLISLYSFGGSFGGTRRLLESFAVELLIAALVASGCLVGNCLLVRCLDVKVSKVRSIKQRVRIK